MAEGLRACVLAAGKGTRMGGSQPKVLFEAGGKPLIHWVLSALTAASVSGIVAVVGFKKNEVIRKLPTGVCWVEQSPQLGTGHAVMCARFLFEKNEFAPELAGSPIIVTCGDMPLLSSESFKAIAELRKNENAAYAVLTVAIPEGSPFGRIIRDETGAVEKIVEAKDATAAELAVLEGNTGVFCFTDAALWKALESIGNDNAQGEYYLTDVISILLNQGEKVVALQCSDPLEALGVNTPDDLEIVNNELKKRNQ